MDGRKWKVRINKRICRKKIKIVLKGENKTKQKMNFVVLYILLTYANRRLAGTEENDKNMLSNFRKTPPDEMLLKITAKR